MNSTALYTAGRTLVRPERLNPLSLDNALRASRHPRSVDPFKLNVPVLVVDDEPANLLAMEAVLAGAGIEFVGVASGADALRCLIERDFALILLDVNMPGLDGIETAALIRARPASAHIPIIFVTAHAGDTARMLKAYETGAADFVIKPYEPIVLRSKVAVFAELYRAAELKRHAAELEANNRVLEADAAINQQLAAQLAHQASHDVLTGLPNRSLFEEIVREALALARRNGQHAAVVFVDLDRLKHINDTFGHDAGDEVLRETARRLNRTIRESDVAARLGGDEFAVLLTGFVHWQESSLLAQRLLRVFAEPFKVGGRSASISPSIGIAIFPDDGADGTTLLKRADAAMYGAKKAGGNAYRFCVAEMNGDMAMHQSLGSDLHSALAAEELVLHYQPKVHMATGRINGVEALVRWQHPQRGVVMASEFMDLARESGLVVPIGERVFGAVCGQARAWREVGLTVSIAINLSARELRGERLLRLVHEAFNEALIEPAMIEFEVAGHAPIFENSESLAILYGLQNAGCRIALDDFGSGYSGLALLTRFPFDSLKLDHAFVADMPGNEPNAAIAEAVLGLARRLRLSTVAVGVTNVEQLRFLQDLGCDQIQGEWISMPLPADPCAAFIRSRQGL